MPSQPSLVQTLRLTHRYLGIFVAPALLFFALTGAFQTFSLHEASRDGDYKPPRALMVLAQLHKNQTPQIRERPPGGGRPDKRGGPDGAKADKRPADNDAAKPEQRPGDPDAVRPGPPAGDPDAARTQKPDGVARPEGGAANSEPPKPPDRGDERRRHNPLPLKIFFLLVSISLFVSTLTGIYMAYKFTRDARLVTILLAAGTAIPLGMILL